MEVDMEGFHKAMLEQKTRSRADAEKDLSDWITVNDDEPIEFVGYDSLEADCEILRYREVKTKGKTQYQLVFNRTPFYAESGGQVGDTGLISNSDDSIEIIDTQKENNLIVHYTEKLPSKPDSKFHAEVNGERRRYITSNHSATHLMHSALKLVLGTHVAQKGSLVNESLTRFDFSHFTKVTDDELERVERIVNEKIRENIRLNEQRNVPIAKAMESGATALFGEKYGEFVRVITFDPSYSVELCGGTHVRSTGEIGLFKFISESSVAAGVRRVEAITGYGAENYFREQEKELQQIKSLLKTTGDPVKSIQSLLDDQEMLRRRIEELILEKAGVVRNELKHKITSVNGINLIAEKIELPSAEAIKNISYDLRNQVDNLVLLLGAEIEGKPHVSLIISDSLVKEKNMNASQLIRTIAKEIQGGGGGQAFYATAGGKNVAGLSKAIETGKRMLMEEGTAK